MSTAENFPRRILHFSGLWKIGNDINNLLGGGNVTVYIELPSDSGIFKGFEIGGKNILMV